MLELLEILRPKQWYKNLVIFAAIFFSKNITNTDLLLVTIMGFIALCLVSSASYIINDMIDVEADKNHDKKKMRPLPSGRLGFGVAGIWAGVVLVIGFMVGTTLGAKFTVALMGFFILTSAYNLFVKNIPFADVSLLSTNFMIRGVAGAYAISVLPSPWLLLGTYLLALFLAIAKRKTDLEILGEKAKQYKKVFETYTIKILEQFLGIVTGLLFITYCLYSFLNSSAHSIIIMGTIPIVSFLIFRYYNFAITNHEMARRAEEVFTDVPMVCGMILWGFIFILGIYHKEIQTIFF